MNEIIESVERIEALNKELADCIERIIAILDKK